LLFSAHTCKLILTGQTNTVIGNPIPVGPLPSSIAFDSSNGNLYVTNLVSGGGTVTGTVSMISGQTNTVVGSPISVGNTPAEIAFDPANGNLYVTNFVDNTVSVISGSTNQVIATIPVGVQPLGVAFDSANGNLYVTNYSHDLRGTVSVISGKTNTVIGNPIPVGSGPEGIAFDSANGNLYVVNSGDNPGTVSVISGQTNTVIGSPIPVGNLPQFIAFDSANGNMYVTNRADGTVSVISTLSSQTPPDTTITSAVDGNRATVQNAGTTLSTSIQFTFTATPGTKPIAGFECRLDNSAFSPCTSPTTLTNLPAGKHNFQVRAVDTEGNRDPTPASFSWNILTPAQGIQQLIQLIQSMGLNHGTQTSLTAPLNAALSQLTNNNPNSVGTACNQLNAFVNHVNADSQNGQLSSTQASQLIHAAQNIQTALGCTSGNGIVASSLSASQTSSSNNNNNLTHRQESQQPQTTTSSPLLLYPQLQFPYSYPSQYHYPLQYPYHSQTPQPQSSQNQQLPPIAYAGISQTVNENTKVTLDGRASYSLTGGVIVAYQWTQLPNGIPITLAGVNAATPTFTAPVVPTDTVLAFSLRVVDNHGAVSTNPAIVYVMVKQNPNVISNSGATGGITPGTTIIQPQQQQQPIVPNNNAISPPSQLKSFPQKGSPTSQNTFPSRVP
jgi:YVTN family beta-propeller protein